MIEVFIGGALALSVGYFEAARRLREQNEREKRLIKLIEEQEVLR